ncbi:MAG: hypothetical protein ACREQW_15000 [Candidatus Binatia bacterium]
MRRLPLAFIFGGFVAAAAAAAWFLGAEQHGEFWWSRVYGFFSLFGFIGCLAIIVFAKLVLGPWLQRDETYYHRRNLP